MTLVGRFREFFGEVNGGAAPYPWQCDLVEKVADTGRWPDIVAPTGSGKSSVIDAHVFLVAEDAAGRLSHRIPRRLVMVAPRRVLVDDQFERAQRLSQELRIARDSGSASPAADAARALACLCTSEITAEPLPVWRLRGGALLEDGWRLEPAACQVPCSTPLMWGSRLLLRGFGASRRSRNLEAGLLGQDVVVVIDEAHLHERLVETGRNVAERTPEAMGLQVVAMSATRAASGRALGLSDDDLLDRGLRRRVDASKTVDLIEVANWPADVPAAIVDRARQLKGRGTVGVFVNNVPTALQVAASLSNAHGADVELVCGRLRLADVQRLRERRPGLLGPSGNVGVDFLVSTQSLEVGVDLDLPAMVTTLAPASTLAQRAGRLNRSGGLDDAAFSVVAPADLADADPVALGTMFAPYEGAEMVAAARWLRDLGDEISPSAVAASTLPEPDRPLLPRLGAIDLETLAMSSSALAADPDVELYLEDPSDVVAEVGIVARRRLDYAPEVVEAALVACPPRAHEIATMRFGKALDQVVQAALTHDVKPWIVRMIDGQLSAELFRSADDLLPGDTLVVASGTAICTNGVVGLGDVKGRAEGFEEVLEEVSPGAPVDRVVALPVEDVETAGAADRDFSGRVARNAVAEVLAAAGAAEAARVVRRHRRLTDLEVVWCGGPEPEGLLVVRETRRRAPQAPLASSDEPVTVDAHQELVECRMRMMLEALRPVGLGAESEQLALAARHHDEGKRHPRFQARMGESDLVLAKPLPGHRPDRGDGWRHEQLSAAYAAATADGDPLVVTLVAGHHGVGRAMFDRDAGALLESWGACPESVAAQVERLFGAHGRYEIDRSRTERILGVHRLAYLEALLRCADMQVSREGH